jgi:N-acetylmuramoyl-L-alanine amidase
VSSRVAGLRVHTSPSLSAGLVTTAYKGEKMTVIARQGSWVEVRMPNGQIGWVSAAYTSGSHRASGTATYQSRAYSHTAVVSTTTTTFSGTKARAAINVHAAPSLKGTVVTVIAPGQKYQVLGWSNGWAHVRLANGATGWVSGTVLGSPKATYHPVTAPTTARTSSRYAGHYLTAGVRVHATASLKGKVVTVAAKGTHVVVLGFSNGFALIRLPNGTTGYVYGSYVR